MVAARPLARSWVGQPALSLLRKVKRGLVVIGITTMVATRRVETGRGLLLHKSTAVWPRRRRSRPFHRHPHRFGTNYEIACCSSVSAVRTATIAHAFGSAS